MFLREKTINGSTYLYLVESVREGSRTKQRIIKNLGRKDKVLESGELGTGQQRSYAAGEVSRVVLGNSSAVEVRQAGKTVDLTPFSRANVARFTLSSDGSLTPGD